MHLSFGYALHRIAGQGVAPGERERGIEPEEGMAKEDNLIAGDYPTIAIAPINKLNRRDETPACHARPRRSN